MEIAQVQLYRTYSSTGIMFSRLRKDKIGQLKRNCIPKQNRVKNATREIKFVPQLQAKK